jgi:phosphotransacetylase
MTEIGTGKYELLLERCRGLDPIPTAVAYPCEESALAGAIDAGKLGLITPILVGPAAKIREIAEKHNAISRDAAKMKGIVSEVAGDPDILLAPDLEAGNMMAKQLSFLANADSAGLVLGAKVPIILTSRADSVRSRIASCGVAVRAAHARRQAPS